MSNSVVRLARRAVLPLLLLALSVSPLATGVNAQDMGMGPSSQEMMNTTMVMVPVGSEMVSVTVNMPMSMMGMATMTQPHVRNVPGGYEIDYGGPTVRIERFGEER